MQHVFMMAKDILQWKLTYLAVFEPLETVLIELCK